MEIFGAIVEEDGIAAGLITVEGQTITKFTRTTLAPETAHRYSLSDCVIFPGFIDIHTHCREDVSQREVYKESYETVGLAALSGGVTFIADMPNNPIAPITQATYEAKRKLTKACPVDVLLYAGVGPGTKPFSDEVPYKVYMGPSVGDLFFSNNRVLENTINNYARCAVSFHCEQPELLKRYEAKSTHEQRRPPACEIEAINFAIELIRRHKLRGKICHVSTHEGLDLIRKARASSIDVTMEVTPHHLYFDVMNLGRDRHWLQMNPPLRERRSRDELLAGVRHGDIQYLASDHAPHTVEEKLTGISGVPNLDTYGPFVAWLLKQGISSSILFNMCCRQPGAWVGSFTKRKVGRIQPGYEASITVLNTSKAAVDGRPLYTKCNWSPFDLRQLPGMVQAVYLKGEKVIDEQYIKNFRT